jgi:hypothetical protein
VAKVDRASSTLHQLYFVTSIADGGCDEFQAQRLKPEVNLGIHEAARMNSEELHMIGVVG